MTVVGFYGLSECGEYCLENCDKDYLLTKLTLAPMLAGPAQPSSSKKPARSVQHPLHPTLDTSHPQTLPPSLR